MAWHWVPTGWTSTFYWGVASRRASRYDASLLAISTETPKQVKKSEADVRRAAQALFVVQAQKVGQKGRAVAISEARAALARARASTEHAWGMFSPSGPEWLGVGNPRASGEGSWYGPIGPSTSQAQLNSSKFVTDTRNMLKRDLQAFSTGLLVYADERATVLQPHIMHLLALHAQLCRPGGTTYDPTVPCRPGRGMFAVNPDWLTAERLLGAGDNLSARDRLGRSVIENMTKRHTGKGSLHAILSALRSALHSGPTVASAINGPVDGTWGRWMALQTDAAPAADVRAPTSPTAEDTKDDDTDTEREEEDEDEEEEEEKKEEDEEEEEEEKEEEEDEDQADDDKNGNLHDVGPTKGEYDTFARATPGKLTHSWKKAALKVEGVMRHYRNPQVNKGTLKAAFTRCDAVLDALAKNHHSLQNSTSNIARLLRDWVRYLRYCALLKGRIVGKMKKGVLVLPADTGWARLRAEAKAWLSAKKTNRYRFDELRAMVDLVDSVSQRVLAVDTDVDADDGIPFRPLPLPSAEKKETEKKDKGDIPVPVQPARKDTEPAPSPDISDGDDSMDVDFDLNTGYPDPVDAPSTPDASQPVAVPPEEKKAPGPSVPPPGPASGNDAALDYRAIYARERRWQVTIQPMLPTPGDRELIMRSTLIQIDKAAFEFRRLLNLAVGQYTLGNWNEGMYNVPAAIRELNHALPESDTMTIKLDRWLRVIMHSMMLQQPIGLKQRKEYVQLIEVAYARYRELDSSTSKLRGVAQLGWLSELLDRVDERMDSLTHTAPALPVDTANHFVRALLPTEDHLLVLDTWPETTRAVVEVYSVLRWYVMDGNSAAGWAFVENEWGEDQNLDWVRGPALTRVHNWVVTLKRLQQKKDPPDEVYLVYIQNMLREPLTQSDDWATALVALTVRGLPPVVDAGPGAPPPVSSGGQDPPPPHAGGGGDDRKESHRKQVPLDYERKHDKDDDDEDERRDRTPSRGHKNSSGNNKAHRRDWSALLTDNDWTIGYDEEEKPIAQLPGDCIHIHVRGWRVYPHGRYFPTAFESTLPQFDIIVAVAYSRLAWSIRREFPDDPLLRVYAFQALAPYMRDLCFVPMGGQRNTNISRSTLARTLWAMDPKQRDLVFRYAKAAADAEVGGGQTYTLEIYKVLQVGDQRMALVPDPVYWDPLRAPGFVSSRRDYVNSNRATFAAIAWSLFQPITENTPLPLGRSDQRPEVSGALQKWRANYHLESTPEDLKAVAQTIGAFPPRDTDNYGMLDLDTIVAAAPLKSHVNASWVPSHVHGGHRPQDHRKLFELGFQDTRIDTARVISSVTPAVVLAYFPPELSVLGNVSISNTAMPSLMDFDWPWLPWPLAFTTTGGTEWTIAFLALLRCSNQHKLDEGVYGDMWREYFLELGFRNGLLLAELVNNEDYVSKFSRQVGELWRHFTNTSAALGLVGDVLNDWSGMAVLAVLFASLSEGTSHRDDASTLSVVWMTLLRLRARLRQDQPVHRDYEPTSTAGRWAEFYRAPYGTHGPVVDTNRYVIPLDDYKESYDGRSVHNRKKMGTVATAQHRSWVAQTSKAASSSTSGQPRSTATGGHGTQEISFVTTNTIRNSITILLDMQKWRAWQRSVAKSADFAQ